ncbi:Response regulator receiver domain-containing protein [Shimia gijangensis]|uniref:Response regulator receiver domain-containing protein n=1 Tax=Shimia gijangensis TaxID=1470563 RepID=A0A1M6GK58_9RHOB|nr:response regulator [Shimia gijangensis]SHJ10290.1 Response regulator receiver domain-containing protein [Shimia gijangensis]
MGELNRILHVEDDPDIQAIVKICLETIGGYELLQCLSGREAIEQAESYAPDLFVLDMMMPGMNGVETLEALRENAALTDVPAIFVTSLNAAGKHEKSIQDLAIGMIPKPFDPTLLAEQIQDLWSQNVG